MIAEKIDPASVKHSELKKPARHGWLFRKSFLTRRSRRLQPTQAYHEHLPPCQVFFQAKCVCTRGPEGEWSSRSPCKV